MVAITGCAVTPPAAPVEDDPAYAVGPLPTWALVGDAVTEGTDALSLRVTPPPDVDGIVAWLDGEEAGVLEPGDGAFELTLDLLDLPTGEHELLLALPGADVAFAAHTFFRSHPLYVYVSVDWDRANTGDGELAWQSGLHVEHPALRLTQFVGPYTFTDPAVDDDREQLLIDWLMDNEADFGDEAGLHIHPRCVFVDTTSVPCRTEPSFVYDEDESGYTVFSNAYTEEEYTTLVAESDALFVGAGFAKPTSYRSGGWIADLMVLRALVANGYLVDTSANNWERMEEWEGQGNGALYAWNQENWATIDERSQPYWPSANDILVPGTPEVGILEVPDNGIMADYVETDEIVDMLERNWDGGALDEPTAFSTGFHNVTQSGPSTIIRSRIEGALDHIDQFLATDDAGPIVYGTVSEAALIWP